MNVRMFLPAIFYKYVFVFGVLFTTFIFTENRSKSESIGKHLEFLSMHIPCIFEPLPISFVDERVHRCFMEIHATKNGNAVKRLWGLCRDDFEHDTRLLRECSLMCAVLYKELVAEKIYSSKEEMHRANIPWIYLLPLFMRLNAIPLTKLFDVLDECLQQYQRILEDYAAFNSADSYMAWISEYWWLPAGMIGMAVLSFMRWYNARQSQHANVLLDV